MKKLRMCFLALTVMLIGTLTACTFGVCDVCDRTVIGKNFAVGDMEMLCRDCAAMQKRLAYYGASAEETASSQGSKEETPEQRTEEVEKSENVRSQDAITIEQRKFSTPEQAGEFFIKALSKQDISKALSVFSISDRAKNFDFEAYVNRRRTFALYDPFPETPAFVPLNELFLLDNANMSIRTFLCNLLTDYEVGQLYRVDGAERTAEEIADALDPNALSALKCLRVDRSSAAMQDSEAYKANMQGYCACFGADDAAEYMMLLELGDKLYAAGFSAIEYDGAWQIFSLMPMLAGFPEGGVEETTMEAYQEYLK